MTDRPGAARGETARVADRVAALLAGAHRGARPSDGGPGDGRMDDDLLDDRLLDDGLVDDGLVDDDAGPAEGGSGGRGAVTPSVLTRLWRRVLARVPVRLDPGRRAAWGMGVAVVLAAVVTGLWLLSSRPAPVPVAARVPAVPGTTLEGSSTTRPTDHAAAPATSSPSATPSAPTTLGPVVVDVAGKVARPGLYRLPAGSRVDDALRAAGGARPGVDLTPLNLAAPVSDGEQVVVGLPAGAGAPAAAAAPPASPGAAGSSGAAAGPVNLNTATLDQLDALPGVGPVLAQHILDWRSAHGRFTRVDQLNDVSGIGDVKYADLKALVTV